MTARYQALAQQLARSIQEGLLQPGERLPSLRTFCQDQGTSLMTALAAYRHLEDLGQIEAVPRSGYRVLASAPQPLTRPAILRSRLTALNTRRNDIIAQVLLAMADPNLLPLGFGCPSPGLFPLASLRRLTADLLNAEKELWVSYSPAPGPLELRRQIARRYQARGLRVGPEEVLVTSGAMEALSLSLQLLAAPGDLVAVECPTFFGIADAARRAGAQVLELPGDPDGGLDPARLASACARRAVRAAVLMPSFANPTGSLMDPQRRRAWMEVLQRHGVALLEDDVYGELAWDGHKVEPLCALPRADGLPNLLVGSLSKTLMPGGRIGYVVARSPWIERLTDLKNTSTLFNVTLSEHLAAEALGSGLYDRHLRRLIPGIQAGVRKLRSCIAQHFPPGTRVSDPRGGFLLWVELPKGSDGLDLFRAAMDRGISLAPGCVFSLGPGLERFIRLNGAASGDFDQAMAVLGQLAGAGPASRAGWTGARRAGDGPPPHTRP
jgi:DNA-binding transcriptional MocR family regulator